MNDTEGVAEDMTRLMVGLAIAENSLVRRRDISDETRLDEIPGLCAYMMARALRRMRLISRGHRINFLWEILNAETVGELIGSIDGQ